MMQANTMADEMKMKQQRRRRIDGFNTFLSS
jgi:hypothetical protein